MEHKPVIIAGAGPVGLLIALRLGQAGISTLVLERHHELLRITRAVVYHPVAIRALEKLGLLDVFRANAFQNHQGLAWRDKSGKALAEMPMMDEEYNLMIGQWRMSSLLLQEVKKYPCVEVKFSHQVVGIEQGEPTERAKVMVHREEHGDDVVLSADWVVGADGANSTVRRSLCIPFEGYTYHKFQMIGTDVLHDFAAENGWDTINFVVDPDDWALVAYTGEDEHGRPFGDGRKLWRIAYSEPLDLDANQEALWERAQKRIKTYTQGRGNCQLTRAVPYKLLQRCAKQGRKGRVVLAGDALHSNNPMGGLGLTGGILDASAYGNALVRVIRGGEADSVMTECAEARRQTWLKTTGPTAEANLDRLRSTEEKTVKAREAFFDKLKTDQGFPKQAWTAMNDMLKDDFQRPKAAA